MPDLKISQLPAATSINASGELAIAQDIGSGLTTYRASVSQLQTNSSSLRVATNYTTSGERYIFVTDVTTAPTPRTVTLSTADFTAKAVITIKDETNTAGTNDIVIVSQAGETINNGSSSIDISTNSGSVTLVSDGTTWETIIPEDTQNNVVEKVLIDTSAGPVTYSLPAPGSAAAQKVYMIKDETGNAATNNITVDVSGGGNIDSSANIIINANFGIGRFISNNTQWFTA